MQKLDNLHQLIISLNSSEKRLFKIYVNKHSSGKEKAYLDLFDAFGKIEVYSEAAFRKKLPKSYNIKNLAQNKKYLKDLILKCMREIDDNRAEDTVNELMREQVFLGKKNLFKEQWKRLQKAKEIAEKFELFSRNLEILDAEMSYLIEHDFDESIEYLEVYKEQRSTVVAKIKLYDELIVVKNQIFQTLRRFKKNVNSEQLKLADSYLENFDEEKIIQFKSYQLNYLYYTILANHGDLHQEKERVAVYRYKLVQLCREFPWMVDLNSSKYFVINFNYISSLFSSANFEQMKLELDKLAIVKPNNENDKGEFFQSITLYKILYWLNTGKLEEAEANKVEIEKGVKLFRDKINVSSLTSIFFNYALAFFLNGNYEECINWLERVEDVKNEVRLDLKTFSKVLKSICHFQLESYLLIESLVRSLRRSSQLSESYEATLSALLALSKQGQNQKLVLAKLKEELNGHKSVVGKDVILLWIDALELKKPVNHVYQASLAS